MAATGGTKSDGYVYRPTEKLIKIQIRVTRSIADSAKNDIPTASANLRDKGMRIIITLCLHQPTGY